MRYDCMASIALCVAALGSGAYAQEPKIVATIESKLESVQEYTCRFTVRSEYPDGIVLAYVEDRSFRLPDLFASRLEQTAHGIPGMVGMISKIHFDGTWWWQYAEKPMTRVNGRTTERRVYQSNLNKLAEVGITPATIWSVGILVNPFGKCDRETIVLREETDDAWILEAKPTAGYAKETNTERIRLTIRKEDGVMLETFLVHKDSETTLTVSEVKLNPGLDDSVFVFRPPDGVPVEDRTDDWTKRSTP